MNEILSKQSVSKKKPSRNRYLIAAFCLALLIITVSVLFLPAQEIKSDRDSEAFIRERIAFILEKDPNNLTDEDFARITSFDFPVSPSPQTRIPEFSDIKLFSKFTNLQELHLVSIKYPDKNIPKWIKILAKIGIYNLDERFAIDLSPIENLNALNTLYFSRSSISDITPLKKLINLERLHIDNTYVSDLEPIKGLINLEFLKLEHTRISSLAPIKELKKLIELNITGTHVSDLKPLSGLTNLYEFILDDTLVSDLEPLKELGKLEVLSMRRTQISDLEPLKDLIKLQILDLTDCPNITDQQIEDLQKALPNLRIVKP